MYENKVHILVKQIVDYNNSYMKRSSSQLNHGSLARYVKLRVAHAPGTFSSPPWLSDPDMHHGTCVMHVPWCLPGSLNSGLLWSLWRGKRSRHSWCMRNPNFYVSRKRPMSDMVLQMQLFSILYNCVTNQILFWTNTFLNSLRIKYAFPWYLQRYVAAKPMPKYQV